MLNPYAGCCRIFALLARLAVAALLCLACAAPAGGQTAERGRKAAHSARKPKPKLRVKSAPPAAPAVPPAESYGPPLPQKRKFISSGVLKPKIKPMKKQEPDFPAYSAAVFVPKFFDSHERFERVDLSGAARLRFVTATDFFPFNYINKSGILAGYNVDLARALCAELRAENICRIEALPWEELTEKLAGGGADAMIAGLAPSAATRAAFGFSRAYLRFPARFIVRRGSAAEQDAQKFLQLGADFSQFLALRGGGLSIGVLRGSAHEQMLAAYFLSPLAGRSPSRDSYRGAVQMRGFSAQAELLSALQKGDVDMAFGDGMGFALQMAAQPAAAQPTEPTDGFAFIGGAYTGPHFLGQGMRIAVAQKDKKLLAALNYALQQLERKGKLAELYLRYFPIGFY